MTDEAAFRGNRADIPDSLKTPPATPQKSTVPRRQNRAPRYYNFDRENEVTIKMTDGTNAIVEGSLGADNYKAARALGYLLKVGGKWIAAVGKQRSKPLSLHEAKATAKAMHRGDVTFDKPEDVIASLNRAEATEIDRAAIDLERLPIDILGGSRGKVEPKLHRAILNAECCVPSLMRPQPEGSQATTTHSLMTRTAIRNCRPVWIGGR